MSLGIVGFSIIYIHDLSDIDEINQNNHLLGILNY